MGFFRLLFLFLVIYFAVKTIRRFVKALMNQQQPPRKFGKTGRLTEIEDADYEIIDPKKEDS